MKKYLKTFWNRRFLLSELVKKGVKLKYRRSYLGVCWSLLEPLLTTCVLTIVFGTLFGNNSRDFPMYILCGRLLYTFFSQATKTAARSIRANSKMICKVYVPKYLYPLSCILFNYIIMYEKSKKFEDIYNYITTTYFILKIDNVEIDIGYEDESIREFLKWVIDEINK